MDPLYSLVLAVLSVAAIYKISRIGRREKLLPPGPPGIPILGNLTSIPTENVYLAFTEWAKEYGGVYSLKISSKTVIVISSLEAVHHIMEKNAAITANRPNRVHLNRIFDEDGILAQLQYGPTYRTWRRAAGEVLKPSACEKHVPIQLAEISQLMVDVLDHPENIYDDIKRAVVSMAFAVTFGNRTPSHDAPEARRFFEATRGVMGLSAPGQVPPIDLWPILYYIPDRFVNNWKARCDVLHQEFDSLYSGLVDKAKVRISTGLGNGCIVENLMERAEEYGLDSRSVSKMGGNFLGAGALGTITSIQWAVLLATVYDNAQQKLREELDRVVGEHRLPGLGDLRNLPYLRAFIREVLRFRPVAPVVAPHRASEDQLYNGYLIPKNATLFINNWAIGRDPNIFEDPESFNPDRFLESNQRKGDSWKRLETIPFGAGKRLCPGIYLANQILELTIASLFWGFEFEQHPDSKLDVNNFDVHATLDALPYKCAIKPRSPLKAELMRQNFDSSGLVFAPFERDSVV